MYSRVHNPLFHRCSKFEKFLPIICKKILHFVNFILDYVRLWRHTLSNLHMSKTQISPEGDKIFRNRERLSYSFRNYNLLRSKLGRQFFRLSSTLIYGSCSVTSQGSNLTQNIALINPPFCSHTCMTQDRSPAFYVYNFCDSNSKRYWITGEISIIMHVYVFFFFYSRNEYEKPIIFEILEEIFLYAD